MFPEEPNKTTTNDREGKLTDRYQPHRFATTQWSVVAKIQNSSETSRQQALQALCECYWYPLYAYAVRNQRPSDDSQDLVQSFFAMLIEKNFFAEADKSRGRFRAFLLAAFKNFMRNQKKREHAQKRGGGQTVFSLDFQLADSRVSIQAVDHLTPEQQFERDWAILLLENVLNKLKHEMELQGKSRQC